MLYGEKSREDLNKKAESLFKNLKTKKQKKAVYDQASNKFNMRITTAESMVTFKRDIKEFTTFEVFCIVYCIEPGCLNKYFTEKEIETLSNDRFVEEKINFPISFTAIQVAEDQWISTITVKRLMEFKSAQIINYDENEQRAMRRMKNGGMEIFRPSVNKNSVKAIKETMESGEYVPDPLTFNMGDEADFSYDEEKMKLTVYSIPSGMFNLTDGYHRYLAISSIRDFNPDFNLTMELRITAFSTTKAQRFIYQADQKTQMRKIVSDSYNPGAISNIICARLNDSPLYGLQNMIGRNNSQINSVVLAELIKSLWSTRTVKKENKNRFVAATTKEIGTKWSQLFDQDEKWFSAKYTDELLFVIMVVFRSKLPEEKYTEAINKIYNKLDKESKAILNISSAGVVRKKGVTLIKNLLGVYYSV